MISKQITKQIPLIDCDPNFVHIFRYMFRSDIVSKLGPFAFTIYCCIKTYSNIKTGSAWPGIDKIIEETGISRRKVLDSIKVLCEHGLIKKEKRKGNASQYTILEKIPFEDSNGNLGEINFDYKAGLLQSAVNEIMNVSVTGDGESAKIINIKYLTINVISQQENGTVNVACAEDSSTSTLDKMLALDPSDPIRIQWEREKMLAKDPDDPIRKSWEKRQLSKMIDETPSI